MKNVNSFLRWSFLPNKWWFKAFSRSLTFFRVQNFLFAGRKIKIFEKHLWRSRFFKLQARNLQLYKKWGNSQLFFKDFGYTLCWHLYRLQAWCNCNVCHSVHLFKIEISSHTISNGSSHEEFFFNIAAL